MEFKFGVDNEKSALSLATFDLEQASSYCILRVLNQGTFVDVLRMKGTIILDPVLIRDAIQELSPETMLFIREPIQFDVVQIGATNNRSESDQKVIIHGVKIEEKIK